MHPALSVIFFTVASGAGFGLFSLLYIADVFQLGGGFNREQLLIGGLMAMALIIFGLISSTFHLANPKNAWRAFSRFRTSWLSREGVFALAFMPLGLAYLASIWFDAPAILRIGTGLLAPCLPGSRFFYRHDLRLPKNHPPMAYTVGARQLSCLRLCQRQSIVAIRCGGRAPRYCALYRNDRTDHLDRSGA